MEEAEAGRRHGPGAWTALAEALLFVSGRRRAPPSDFFAVTAVTPPASRARVSCAADNAIDHVDHARSGDCTDFHPPPYSIYLTDPEGTVVELKSGN